MHSRIMVGLEIMGRRERRHHRNRMKAKALKAFYYNKERALYNYDHMCNCSCSGCGNQRHNTWQPLDERLTMQERKAKLMEKDW